LLQAPLCDAIAVIGAFALESTTDSMDEALLQCRPIWLVVSRAVSLRVGRHEVEAYWVFGAMHCDGLGEDPALQCFPAGETLFHSVEFEVTPGHR
jgi:hypothetical protein